MDKKLAIPPLLFGPYLPPVHRKGSWITDEIHGLVQVNGWTNGPLSWPTRKRPGGGPRAVAVTADLARAIRSESAVAIAYWIGISTKTVRGLRRELDVPRNTPGTLARHAAVAELPPAEAVAKGRARVATDPEIRQRISEKQRGKIVTDEARMKMSIARRGKPKTEGWGHRANAWMMEGKRKKRALKSP